MFDFLHKKAQDATPPALPEGTVRRRYSIEGQVQGVGFRYRARYAAQTLELTGWQRDAGSAGRPGKVPAAVRHDPEKRLYPDHRHPPEGSAARPMGAGLLGKRVLI